MKPYRIKMFKELSTKDWRWSLVAPNGKLVAESGEGYQNRKDAVKIWRLLLPWINLKTLRGLPPERNV